MYKSILVPIDLSDLEKAKGCLKLAQNIGDKGAELHLLHVIETVPMYMAAELPEDLLENTKKAAAEALRKVAGSIDGNVQSHLHSGNPNRDINIVAEELGVDLIVVGSHRPGLPDYLLGSTAARVVRHTQCSVLVVRQAVGDTRS